jgi:hypothetical protein
MNEKSDGGKLSYGNSFREFGGGESAMFNVADEGSP